MLAASHRLRSATGNGAASSRTADPGPGGGARRDARSPLTAGCDAHGGSAPFSRRTDDLLRRMDRSHRRGSRDRRGRQRSVSIGLIDEALRPYRTESDSVCIEQPRYRRNRPTDSSASLATQVNDQTLDAAVIFGPPPGPSSEHHIQGDQPRPPRRIGRQLIILPWQTVRSSGRILVIDLVIEPFNPMSGTIPVSPAHAPLRHRTYRCCRNRPEHDDHRIRCPGQGHLATMTLDAHPQLRRISTCCLSASRRPVSSGCWSGVPTTQIGQLRRFLDSFGPKLKGLAAG